MVESRMRHAEKGQVISLETILQAVGSVGFLMGGLGLAVSLLRWNISQLL